MATFCLNTIKGKWKKKEKRRKISLCFMRSSKNDQNNTIKRMMMFLQLYTNYENHCLNNNIITIHC